MLTATAKRQQVRTFIILGDDGRHINLGGRSEPDAAETAAISAKLAETGHGACLLRMDGDCFARSGRFSLTAMSVVAPANIPFTGASAGFRAIRCGAAD